MREKILITAALPYANGPIHFGHIAGVYLPADAYARFMRLKGCDVLFISGSDEYGVAITLSAEQNKRTPKEHIDLYHSGNKSLFKKVNIAFDHYSRTTCSEHKELAQQFFLELLENGYIEEKETDQLYSQQDKKFLADRYVEGICPKCGADHARGDECPKCGGAYEATELKQPRSKLTGSPLVLKKTKHWFLRCELFKEKLLNWLETRDWKTNVTNFIKPYIEDLRPRAITRDLDWGIPVPLPHAEGKVLYVWFDAPIGYISATLEWAKERGEKEAWKKYWLDERTKYVQFLGKDNIVFHAMFFPAMIMGQNTPYKLVDELPANEFYNLEGKKFNKSSGWTIDIEEFLQTFTPDCLRYMLAATAPETQDSEFTYKDFQMRVNTELVGKLGNFVHRTLSFLHTRMEQEIPESLEYDDADNGFLEDILHIAKEGQVAYENFRLRKASQCIMELCDRANAYFDHKKPWVLLRNKETSQELATTMYACLTAIKTLAMLSYPIIPEAADKIWKMLGFSHPISTVKWDDVLNTDLIPGTKLPTPEILFTKIEDEVVQKEVLKLQEIVDKKTYISYEEFEKVELRVGKIEEVEIVPKSSKLLKLLVNLGEEKRTIVSGIAKHFQEPNTLIGKKVVVVTNLKPAKLMGIESQGMILAAGEGEFLELPMLCDAEPGMIIK